MTVHLLALLLAQVVVYVPPPEPLTQVYHGQGISFRYPQNWQFEEREGSLVVAPRAARSLTKEGTEFFSHGLFVGFFRPSWRTTLGGATEELVRSFRQANPGIQRVPGQEHALELVGRPARVVGWANPDTPLGPEGGILVVVEERHGFWWWLMFAPAFDLEAYSSTFAAIADSIRFEREPEAQVQEHSERRLPDHPG